MVAAVDSRFVFFLTLCIVGVAVASLRSLDAGCRLLTWVFVGVLVALIAVVVFQLMRGLFFRLNRSGFRGGWLESRIPWAAVTSVGVEASHGSVTVLLKHPRTTRLDLLRYGRQWHALQLIRDCCPAAELDPMILEAGDCVDILGKHAPRAFHPDALPEVRGWFLRCVSGAQTACEDYIPNADKKRPRFSAFLLDFAETIVLFFGKWRIRFVDDGVTFWGLLGRRLMPWEAIEKAELVFAKLDPDGAFIRLQMAHASGKVFLGRFRHPSVLCAYIRCHAPRAETNEALRYAARVDAVFVRPANRITRRDVALMRRMTEQLQVRMTVTKAGDAPPVSRC